MNPSTYTPLFVQEVFRSLLSDTPATTSAAQPPTTATYPRLTSPPAKNSIRPIENDENNRREKYDGCRWRLVCTWSAGECTNIAYTRQLCAKHNSLQRNKELPKKKRKTLLTTTSLPLRRIYHLDTGKAKNDMCLFLVNVNNRNDAYPNDDDDDDIQIIEELYKKPTIRHTMASNVKWEASDFNVFSVDHVDEADTLKAVKSEPATSSTHQTSSSADIEYVSSSLRADGLNVSELTSKNIPPLTEFEEECISDRMIERLPANSLMLDAQLFLHNEATTVVKRNYRLKMDKVAAEYFYDFLLRHPRVALHFKRWFTHCKPSPPTTGCPIDTKFWTLSMIVRGVSASDRMDET